MRRYCTEAAGQARRNPSPRREKESKSIWMCLRPPPSCIEPRRRSTAGGRRQIPHRKYGRRLIFKRSELERLIETLPGVPLGDVST